MSEYKDYLTAHLFELQENTNCNDAVISFCVANNIIGREEADDLVK